MIRCRYEQLTDEERVFVDAWAERLPPKIARKKVDWFLGGVLSSKNLANLDSLGRGVPADLRVRVGEGIMYETRDLLAWLVGTRGVKRLKGVRGLTGFISELPNGVACGQSN